MPQDLDKILKIIDAASKQAKAADELAAVIPFLKLLIEEVRSNNMSNTEALTRLSLRLDNLQRQPGPAGARGKAGAPGTPGEDADPEEVAAILKADKVFLARLKPQASKPGERGLAPAHEWDGTRLRFQRPDGTWGEWMDLGIKRTSSLGSFFGFGGTPGGSMGIERVRFGSQVVEGPATVEFAGTAITGFVKTPNGVKITISDTGGGGSGGALSTALEVIAGSQSGNDVILDTSGLSNSYTTILGVFRNGILLAQTDDWSQAGADITVLNADAGDKFQIQYTYVSSGVETTTSEVISASQNGTSVDIDLTALAHTYIAVLGVYRNGILQTPTDDWSQSGDTINIPSADASEKFQVLYTY